MANYPEVKDKLTNTQLNKLKSAAKNKTQTILTLNKKKFEDEELPHELFLITRQTTDLRNALLTTYQQRKNLVKLKNLK